MSTRVGRIFLAIVFSCGCAYAQELPGLPAPGDSRHSMLREAMLGLLRDQRARLVAEVRKRCLKLPVAPPNDRLAGPHGDTLVSESCRVAEVRALSTGALSQWTMARYQWTSIFTAEERSRGEDARDTVAEEEVVVFDAPDVGQLRPVWHARFETRAYAVWRSITPELAVTAVGTTLLSVMSCMNGTGGCGQEFLQRTREGRWSGVNQVWLDQLPAGFSGRIRHGVRIDQLPCEARPASTETMIRTAVRRNGWKSTWRSTAARWCCAMRTSSRNPPEASNCRSASGLDSVARLGLFSDH
jgi:hypothetical protein